MHANWNASCDDDEIKKKKKSVCVVGLHLKKVVKSTQSKLLSQKIKVISALDSSQQPTCLTNSQIKYTYICWFGLEQINSESKTSMILYSVAITEISANWWILAAEVMQSEHEIWFLKARKFLIWHDNSVCLLTDVA